MSTSVDTLSEQVEAKLAKTGLKVTIGGAPTFIPEHPDGAE